MAVARAELSRCGRDCHVCAGAEEDGAIHGAGDDGDAGAGVDGQLGSPSQKQDGAVSEVRQRDLGRKREGRWWVRESRLGWEASAGSFIKKVLPGPGRETRSANPRRAMQGRCGGSVRHQRATILHASSFVALSTPYHASHRSTPLPHSRLKALSGPVCVGGRAHLPSAKLSLAQHNRLAFLSLDLHPRRPSHPERLPWPALVCAPWPALVCSLDAIRASRDCAGTGGKFGAGGGAQGAGGVGSGRPLICRRRAVLPGLAFGPWTSRSQSKQRRSLRIAGPSLPPRGGKAGPSWSGRRGRMRRAGIGGRNRTMPRPHG